MCVCLKVCYSRLAPVDDKVWHQNNFLLSLCTFGFDTGPHSQPKAHCLLQSSSCLYSPGLLSQYHVRIILLHGFWRSEIMFSCLRSKHLAHWMISQVLGSFPPFLERGIEDGVRRTVHGEKLVGLMQLGYSDGRWSLHTVPKEKPPGFASESQGSK